VNIDSVGGGIQPVGGNGHRTWPTAPLTAPGWGRCFDGLAQVELVDVPIIMNLPRAPECAWFVHNRRRALADPGMSCARSPAGRAEVNRLPILSSA
jgi:hypothetical protein